MELASAIPTSRPQLFGNAWQRGGTMRKLGLAGGVLSDFAAGLRGQPVGYAGAMVDEELDQHRRDLARWMLPENLRDLYDLSPQTALARAFPAPQTPVKLGEGDSLVNPETGASIVQGTPKPRIFNTGQSIVSVGQDGQPQVLYQDPQQTARAEWEPASDAEKSALGLPDTAAVVIDRRTGKPQVLSKQRQYTEFAGKAAEFANRMAGAAPKIAEFEAKADFKPSLAWSQGLAAGSETAKSYRVAMREWIAALLRKDTGAAVTPQEFEFYGQTYFPVPGDGKEQISMKAGARARALNGVRAASQGAYEEWFQPSAETTPGAPSKRLKYNPATGALE